MAETDIKSINKRAIHDTKAREDIEKLSSQFKDIAKQIESGGNVINYNLPNIFFTGDMTDMSKENEKILAINYRSQRINFDGYVKMKWQGT